MNLARHAIYSTRPLHIFDARFDQTSEIFTVSTLAGFAVYQTWPLKLVRKRDLTGGTLALVVPLHTSSLLFLVGGGRSPLYPPNKVVLWDDALGTEVAELEFRERVRGLACRRGWLAVSLRRRVVIFQIGQTVTRYAEYDTCDNPNGLLSLAAAPYATLLAIAGRQVGHVQLIHLPPCPPPVLKGPPVYEKPPKQHPSLPAKPPISIIVAHESALTTLAVPPSGNLLATTSAKGTLVRVWDARKGTLVHEFRRGADKAEIYGVAFRPDERELCVWSDKGTVHLFALGGSGVSNRQSMMQQLNAFIPLPKYFQSEWSYAHYRIPSQTAHLSISASTQHRSPTDDVPDEERCVVGWIPAPSDSQPLPGRPVDEYQLVALTYTGGWYRLSTPRPVQSGETPPSSPKSTSFSSKQRRDSASTIGRSDKGKGKEEGTPSRRCTLEEFRRFGRWDGWG
ncbi:SVP1-like protein 2 [Flagelloscypha sp. PMI_526]|nr:SVP1-like protein 2 [Flagelloscypha sp. PMI_526]